MIEGGRSQTWHVDRSNYWCMVVESRMRRSDDFGTATRRNSIWSSRITLRFPWPVGTVANYLLRVVITQHRFLVAFSAQIRHTRTIILGFCVDSCPILGNDCSKIFERDL